MVLSMISRGARRLSPPPSSSSSSLCTNNWILFSRTPTTTAATTARVVAANNKSITSKSNYSQLAYCRSTTNGSTPSLRRNSAKEYDACWRRWSSNNGGSSNGTKAKTKVASSSSTTTTSAAAAKPPTSTSSSTAAAAAATAAAATATTAAKTKTNNATTTFLQRFLAPKPMPPRNTRKWYAEMALICTVFGITGSSTMFMVRPAVSEVLGLKGSMKEGPWSYRICSLVIMTPIYATLLVMVGTVFGRHAYFRHFSVKMWSRFGVPPELMDPHFKVNSKNFKKW